MDEGAASEVILETWARAALQAVTALGDGVDGVGIAVPAPFDYGRGVSLMEHKFRALYGRPVVSLLEEWFRDSQLEGAPVLVANDADLFALGEWWAGAARGRERMIGLTLGTGLGSGFVAHGRIVTGGPEVPTGERSGACPTSMAWPRTSSAGGRSRRRTRGRLVASWPRARLPRELTPGSRPRSEHSQRWRCIWGGSWSRILLGSSPSASWSAGALPTRGRFLDRGWPLRLRRWSAGRRRGSRTLRCLGRLRLRRPERGAVTRSNRPRAARRWPGVVRGRRGRDRADEWRGSSRK